MNQEPLDVPCLLDRIIDASRLDDGTPEYRDEVVALLLTAIRALESAVQKVSADDPALRARLNHLESEADWLQRMSQVYSTVEWPIHVQRAARDTRLLCELLEQRSNG